MGGWTRAAGDEDLDMELSGVFMSVDSGRKKFVKFKETCKEPSLSTMTC